MEPILVTGSPRSGTTWIGKMISISNQVGYIHEAFNFLIKKNLPGDPDPFHFLTITESNEKKLQESFKKILEFDFPFWEQFTEHKSFNNFFNCIIHWFRFRRYKKSDQIPLIKDPYSVLATKWLVDTLNLRPICVVRHPGAIYDSMNRLNWEIDLNQLSNSLPEGSFANEYLNEFDVLENGHSRAAKVGIVWSIIYKKIQWYDENTSNWLILRYEDIFTNLEKYFKEIYNHLNLDIDDEILSKIYYYSSNGYFPSDRKSTDVTFNRDSLLNGWKDRVSKEEQQQIKEIIDQSVITDFYDKKTWEKETEY